MNDYEKQVLAQARDDIAKLRAMVTERDQWIAKAVPFFDPDHRTPPEQRADLPPPGIAPPMAQWSCNTFGGMGLAEGSYMVALSLAEIDTDPGRCRACGKPFDEASEITDPNYPDCPACGRKP